MMVDMLRAASFSVSLQITREENRGQRQCYVLARGESKRSTMSSSKHTNADEPTFVVRSIDALEILLVLVEMWKGENHWRTWK